MKVLLLNQCFWPDVVATAQQLTDLAVGLAERGHEVTVVASDRGYDDPKVRFPKIERWKGITIHRVRSLAIGKNTRLQRMVNFGSFFLTCGLRLALLPRQDVAVALTSPPLISWLGSLFTRLKGGRLVSWVMDLNPDEAIAADWVSENSIGGRILGARLKSSLDRSEKIVALDRFVKQRIVAKGIPEDKVAVISPWSHDDLVRYDSKGREAFRREHHLTEKFVVMYAGNHSPCHPLDTLLDAARALKDRKDVVFCFVGGGSEKKKVEECARVNDLESVRLLPYCSLADLSASLSAADLHIVVMGEAFVGIVHPSKIYNILAIGSPFVYIGPEQSHVVDIVGRLSDRNTTLLAGHGEVDRIAGFILEAAETNGQAVVQPAPGLAQQFSREVLLPRMIDLLESVSSRSEVSSAEVTTTKMQSA
jgi:colanic acid biosynthesis glycosyl transferase WcaI